MGSKKACPSVQALFKPLFASLLLNSVDQSESQGQPRVNVRRLYQKQGEREGNNLGLFVYNLLQPVS